MFRAHPIAIWRAEARATLLLAWPLILTQLAHIALTTVDALLLGRLGPEALATGALALNLYNAFLLFGIGVMTATMAMIARERGRRAHSVREIRRTFRQALWMAASLAIPMWVVLWRAEPILALLGQDPALSHEAAALMRALMWSLLPAFAAIGLRGFMAAMERPMWTTAIGLLAVPVDAAVGWALIFGEWGAPRLGVVGAGFATLAAASFMFVALAIVSVLHPRFRCLRLFAGIWRPDGERWLEFLKLGLPIGLMIAFETTVFNAAAFLAGLFGTATLAAHAVTLQIASVAFMIPLGLSMAVTVRVGIAFGRGDRDAVFVAGWTGWGLAACAMATTATTMLVVPDVLIGAFLDLRDPATAETARLARTFLRVAALFQLVDGIQSVSAGMLRGLHDTRVPMVIAGFGYWGVGLTTCVVLAFPGGFAGLGVWFGLAAGLGVVAFALTVRWTLLTRPRPSAAARYA